MKIALQNTALALLFAVIGAFSPLGQVGANAGPARAEAIMRAVSERAEARRVQAQIGFDLRDSRGEVQSRSALLLRSIDAEYKKVAMYFSAPRALRGSSFLAWNAESPGVDDEQWLYLPSLRRVRRIPGRERGQAFLGTDLSYGDITLAAKLDLADWKFESAVEGEGGLWLVTARAASTTTAEETGYLRARWTIDVTRAFPIKSEFWDTQDAPLKVVEYRDIVERRGTLLADTIEVRNLKTGHVTALHFSDVQVDVDAKFDDALLTPAQLGRGP